MEKETEEFKQKVLDKYMKIVTNEGRIIIGKSQCIDNSGTIYLVDVVEVFDNNCDFKALLNLFENQEGHNLYFSTDKFNYQIYSNTIVPLKEVKHISILK